MSAFYRRSFGRIDLSASWEPSPDPARQGCCRSNPSEVQLHFSGPEIRLDTLTHETYHAIDALAFFGSLNGGEEEAQAMGELIEEMVAALLDQGWSYSQKAIGVFHVGKLVALAPPTT